MALSTDPGLSALPGAVASLDVRLLFGKGKGRVERMQVLLCSLASVPEGRAGPVLFSQHQHRLGHLILRTYKSLNLKNLHSGAVFRSASIALALL